VREASNKKGYEAESNAVSLTFEIKSMASTKTMFTHKL